METTRGCDALGNGVQMLEEQDHRSQLTNGEDVDQGKVPNFQRNFNVLRSLS